jgi:hypothetical protein
MPDVEVKLEADGAVTNGKYSPTVGSEVVLRFDPLKTTVGIDYSQPDSLQLKVAGELSLQSSGLTLGLEADRSLAGKTSMSGSLTWTISKDVSATAELHYGTDGASGTATLSVRF